MQHVLDVAYQRVRAVPRTMPLSMYADAIEASLRQEFPADGVCGATRTAATTPTYGGMTCLVAMGLGALGRLMPDGGGYIDDDFALGAYSGYNLAEGSRNLLIGACTATPTPHTSNFVDIDIPGVRLCFWRDTGERADCPVNPCPAPIV